MDLSSLNRARFALGASTALAWLGCAGNAAQPQRAKLEPARVEAAPPVEAEPVQATSTREPILTITDPEVLSAVAQKVGDFGALLMGALEPGQSNAELVSASAAFRSVTEVIERDVQAIAHRDPHAGVSVARHTHRLFDVRWLRAADARFELIAVVNRIDRRAVAEGTCGETRLVYRLAYAKQANGTLLRSRLPMTWIAEYRQPALDTADSCRSVAQRWFAPRELRSAALGAFLLSEQGPLAAARLARENLQQLALNFQSVRWPSGARPDLGGHAEYMLRAFSWDAAAQRYRPRKLENTPDVARLARDARARAALHAWVLANLQGLDTATALIPDEFLAESAVSVTPRGFARLQNRPFRRVFTAQDFAAADLSALRFARSPEALLRRLDDLSCNGCHQSRSIAGFHLVGEDVAEAPGNALAVALSAHAHAEIERRQAYLQAVSAGAAVDQARPFAERAATEPGRYGAHCGLGDPGFADWTCSDGLHCSAYEAALGDQSVGVCLPDVLAVGDPCQPGRVQPNADPQRDRVQRTAELACDYVCEAASVGFPGGMCAVPCNALPRDAACGAIAILSDFNACLARHEPFATCVAQHARPAGLRACSALTPCRDDYICARTPSNAGVCLPPYFVFQLRVDGHP